eukprot:symbB.v1.2.009554.t1/scaffold604.1/size182248/12
MLRLLTLSLLSGSYAQVQVDGSGTTNPSKFFWQIMETMEALQRGKTWKEHGKSNERAGKIIARTLKDIRLTYRAVGSSTGQREFTQTEDNSAVWTSGLTDFGAGDIPMSSSRYAGITGASREMIHVPFCLGAIGVFHSVPAGEVGDSKGLKLSPCVLAKIMQGDITTWDHADIKAENPSLNVPAGTQIKADGLWMDVASTHGYLDAGHGHNLDFQEVNLQNEANTWLTSKDALAATDANGNNGVAAAGQNVVSSKRNSYSLWKLADLAGSMDSMKERLDAMETHLDGYGIVPLHGSGTTNTKNWFAKAMKLMEERARVPLFLTYRAVGSGTGQKEFVGDSNNGYKSYSHFGAGDIPMSQSNYNTMTTHSESMVHIPLALGAIAVFHSVPTGEIGGESLKLDACLLAKIFGGAITTWDHADIKAQNPNINVPANQAIHVFHRDLGSSSTGGITGYLNKKCPTHWTLGAGSTISWPASSNFKPVQGSDGMQANLQANKYGIGYLDAGHGIDFGLSEVALTNLAGKTRTAKESIALGGVAEAGTAAANSGTVFPSDVSADWSSVNLYDMAGDSTWPIILVSYMYVKKDQTMTNPKTAAALKAFISMVVNDDDNLATEFGFTPPSATLKALSLNAANQIMYPTTMKAFEFESSTNAYGGMATNVISVKRHSYDIYDSSVIQAAMTKLEQRVGQVEPMGDGNAQDDDHEEAYNDTLPVVLSIVAFVISLLSGCVGCLAFRAASKSRSLNEGSPYAARA